LFNSISIGINPILLDVGLIALSWHGFFTFVAVVVSVYLVSRWGKGEGISADDVYSVTVWAIVGGIIGARFVHVVDRWDYYGANLSNIGSVWAGGISIYGAIIGGFLGGAGYIWINHRFFKKLANVSVGKLADISAPALLLAQAIGRIGDIVNGEHIASVTSLPWGFIYTHSSSLSNRHHGLVPSHPAVLYEMIYDLFVLVVIWRLRGRLLPSGMLFAVYGMLYAVGRFFLQFLRLDKQWIVGLQEAHIISIIVIALTVGILASRVRFVSKSELAVQDTLTSKRKSKSNS